MATSGTVSRVARARVLRMPDMVFPLSVGGRALSVERAFAVGWVPGRQAGASPAAGIPCGDGAGRVRSGLEAHVFVRSYNAKRCEGATGA
ncbi:hypothetical protein GCM10018779_50990 [Streptomyces griseocarneus]|nr:hypothetical protein GCM10018779_50990 [Streptomyces griseocarneus]